MSDLTLVNKSGNDLIIMVNNLDDPSNPNRLTMLKVKVGESFKLNKKLICDGKLEIH